MTPPSATDGSISVTVLGGYLGAGKTTLLNRILREAPARTAVLVNDFGSVDIDADLIEGATGDGGVVSLANGCICCTISDGLVGAMDTIRAFEPRPERLVIEASGVSQPGDIAVHASLPGFGLDAIVVVVDTEQIRARAKDKFVGDVVLDQLGAGDLLVLNKVDLVSADRLESVRTWLGGVAPGVPTVTAERGELPIDILLGRTPNRRTPGLASERPHRHADARFETWSFSTDQVFDGEKLDAVVRAIPEHVVRVKGIVKTSEDPGRRTIVHRVGARYERSDGGQWPNPEAESRVVAIGVADQPIDLGDLLGEALL